MRLCSWLSLFVCFWVFGVCCGVVVGVGLLIYLCVFVRWVVLFSLWNGSVRDGTGVQIFVCMGGFGFDVGVLCVKVWIGFGGRWRVVVLRVVLLRALLLLSVERYFSVVSLGFLVEILCLCWVLMFVFGIGLLGCVGRMLLFGLCNVVVGGVCIDCLNGYVVFRSFGVFVSC